MWSIPLVILVFLMPGRLSADYVLNNKRFPKDFLFGIASSAYQTEGAWNEDGKGQSIWDNFTHSQPDRIADHSNGDISCDSYHKYKEDIALMKSLGINSYRFSLSWTRILPNGFPSSINPKGIQYYKNLISELKRNNIEPIVSLYHLDLPQTLQDLGGFLNESIRDWFVDYARVCFEAFGDDVHYWTTFNGPYLICVLGYGFGYHAPGYSNSGIDDYICGHNLIKAHAAAYHLYDEEFRKRQNGKVSLVHAILYPSPETNSTEDIAAARQMMDFDVGWIANPTVYGDYPELMKNRVAHRSKLEGFKKSRLPEFTEEEKQFIKNTTDYFAINSYISYNVSAAPEPPITDPPSRVIDYGIDPKFEENNTPKNLGGLLVWIKNSYGNPDIIVAENGYDSKSGDLNDFDKIDYVRESMSRFKDAMDQDGVKLFGYTLWALLDNFDWFSGYTKKFGIYKVDFTSPNRTRTPRKSAEWYKNVIATRCLSDDCVD